MGGGRSACKEAPEACERRDVNNKHVIDELMMGKDWATWASREKISASEHWHT